MRASISKNTMKHPARVWFPWCVIRRDHFDVSFLPCDRGGHPPWKENGLGWKEREKWKLSDWHFKTGAYWKSYAEEDNIVGQNIYTGDCADELVCTFNIHTYTFFVCVPCNYLIYFFLKQPRIWVCNVYVCYIRGLWTTQCFLSVPHHAYVSLHCLSALCVYLQYAEVQLCDFNICN